MDNHLAFIKIIVWPILMNALTDFTVDKGLAALFYCAATFAVIYTTIIPKYKRNKKHKQWVKDGCKAEDRYKWEDVQ